MTCWLTAVPVTTWSSYCTTTNSWSVGAAASSSWARAGDTTEDVATMEFDGRGVCFSPGCGLEGSPQPLAHRHTAAEPSSQVVARGMVGIRRSPPRRGYARKEASIGAADDGGRIYGHRSAMPVPRPAER